jgi:hypothetical protein
MREKRVHVQSNVVGVNVAKLGKTMSVCVAVIGNSDVPTAWTLTAFNANLLAVMLCGFLSVKRKLF